MDRTKKIIIGVVILLGLGFLVWRQWKKDQELGKPLASADLPEIKGSEDVDKIELKSEKADVTLIKKGDKWELSKPVSYAANQQNVKSLLDNMKELKLQEIIASKPDDELKKTYELDGTKATHVVTYKGSDKKFDATFGKSGGRGDMCMIPGHEEIYAAKGYSAWMYTKEAKDWRDKDILKFEDTNVASMIIENKAGKMVFTRTDVAGADGGSNAKWSGKIKDKAIANLDEEKVKNAVGSFKALTASDFSDGKPDSETGMDAPESVVTFTMKDNQTIVMRIGKVASGTEHYARKDGMAQVFVIAAYPSEWATGDLAKYQQPMDAGAGDSGAKPAGSAPPFMPPPMMPPMHH